MLPGALFFVRGVFCTSMKYISVTRSEVFPATVKSLICVFFGFFRPVPIWAERDRKKRVKWGDCNKRNVLTSRWNSYKVDIQTSTMYIIWHNCSFKRTISSPPLLKFIYIVFFLLLEQICWWYTVSHFAFNNPKLEFTILKFCSIEIVKLQTQHWN